MTILMEILALLIRFLIAVVIQWLLYPVVLAICTPFILVACIFSKQPYRFAVSESYDRVTNFWENWGIMFV